MAKTAPLRVIGKTIGDPLAAFLEARGLDIDLAVRAGLWSASRSIGDASFRPDPKGDWVAIPYEVDGRVVNHKYRRLSEKEHAQDKGGEQRFWNECAISDPSLSDDVLVITEGEWDALAARQSGFRRVVSVPGGAPGGVEARLGYLEPVWDALKAVEQIIIAADGDAAGTTLLNVLASRLGPARCRWVTYPEGAKDLNDVLLADGEAGVRFALNGAKFLPMSGVFTDDDLPPSPEWTIWRPRIAPKLDAMLAICPGQWSAWTGKPTEGKTTLAQAVFFDIADRYDMRIAIYTAEKDIGRDLQPEASAWLAGKDIAELTEHDHAMGRLWRKKHLIYLTEPDGGGQSLEWFVERAERAIVEHGCEAVICDPWNTLEHNYDRRAMSETDYTGYALGVIERLARKFGVHIAIVVHPTKLRDDVIPGGYDISGSAHWYNKSYLGVTVVRVDEDGVAIQDRATMVRAWKIKFWKPMGYPGDAYVKLGAGGRFRPWDEAMNWVESRPAKRGKP